MWWTRGALVALVLGLAFVAIRIPSFTKLRNELRFIGDTHADVVATVERPRRAPRAALRTDHAADLPPRPRHPLRARQRRRRISRAVQQPTGGVALVLVGDKPVRRFGKADGVPRGTNVAPPGFTPAAAHGMLRAYAACAP